MDTRWRFSAVRFVALFLLSGLQNAGADEVSYSDCRGGDSGLAGKNGVVYCEPFESEDFWVNKGYQGDAGREKRPINPAEFDDVFLETSDCVSGNCIRIRIPQYQCCGLSVAWPLNEAGMEPENLYFRYYLKLGTNFDPAFCNAKGESVKDGGKFPGLADARSFPDEQCGNGGNPSNGRNCWSMRSVFKSCQWACESTPNATTRFGSYIYHPEQHSLWGDGAVWDGDSNRQPGSTCDVLLSQSQNCPTSQRISCSSGPDVLGTCGVDDIGDLENDRWYAIEMQVQMNTPDQDNGTLRGWVDGQLAYEKTNMLWRLAGHDNLHVRTLWLNIHFGGELVGPCDPGGTEVFMDQMVVSTQPIGVAGSPQDPIDPPPSDFVVE